MKKIIFFLAFYAYTLTAICQPALKWAKCYGGLKDESIGAIAKGSDGNIWVIGTADTSSGDVPPLHGNTNSSDYWLLKLDTLGNILLNKTIGGSLNDRGYTITTTKDGGFLLAGISASTDYDALNNNNHGGGDFWVVKLDTNGNIQWQQCYGGPYIETATSIKESIDGGYLIAGATHGNGGQVIGYHGNSYSDYWVIKTDNMGIFQWGKSLGGTNDESVSSIEATADSGAIVIGNTSSNDGNAINNHTSDGASDILAIKLDKNGLVQWEKCYGGSYYDEGYSIKATIDGGFIIAGQTQSSDGDLTNTTFNGGTFDTWVLKINSVGNIIWSKCYGGSNSDVAYDIICENDGGYIITGSTESNDKDVSGGHQSKYYPNLWTFKIDNIGKLLWQKCLGGTQSFEVGRSICSTSPGNYIIGSYATALDDDVSGNHGGIDYWVVRLQDKSLGLEQLYAQEQQINIYPNPVKENGIVKIESNERIDILELYDLMGEKLLQGKSEDIDLLGISKGVYFLKVNRNKVFKVLIQ